MRKFIILFDEFGTPTFKPTRESNSFIGVGALYELKNENRIFEICDNKFGLSNSKPKKNNSIGKNSAQSIANQLLDLPIQFIVREYKLDNNRFQKTIQFYEEFGNHSRTIFRKTTKNRPIAQILHTSILDHSLFDLIYTHLFNNNYTNNLYEIYIDNWSIISIDKHTYLEGRIESMESKIKNKLKEENIEKILSIPRIDLLIEDTKRKRFIDIVTSVITRFYTKYEYTKEPFTNTSLKLKDKVDYADVTSVQVAFIENFINKRIEETKNT